MLFNSFPIPNAGIVLSNSVHYPSFRIKSRYNASLFFGCFVIQTGIAASTYQAKIADIVNVYLINILIRLRKMMFYRIIVLEIKVFHLLNI